MNRILWATLIVTLLAVGSGVAYGSAHTTGSEGAGGYTTLTISMDLGLCDAHGGHRPVFRRFDYTATNMLTGEASSFPSWTLVPAHRDLAEHSYELPVNEPHDEAIELVAGTYVVATEVDCADGTIVPSSNVVVVPPA